MKNTIIRLMLVTSLVILMAVALAAGGYQIITNRYHLPEEVTQFLDDYKGEKEEALPETIIEDSALKQSIRTLYFIKNPETDAITEILLVMLNGSTQKLKVLTFPPSMKVTVSNTLYQKMKETNVSIPQILKLSMLYQYFNKDEAYEYGMEILKESFEISIDAYAVINEEQYYEYFTEDTDRVQVLKEEYLDISELPVTEKKTKERLSEFYSKLQANFSLERWMPYLETYEKITTGDISFSMIPGEEKNDSFVPEIDNTKMMIIEFTNGI